MAHPHTSSKSADPRVAAFTTTPVATVGTGDFIVCWDGNDWEFITEANLAIQIGGGGAGTVSSVQVSGGTTGLTTSGGPITGSGTITLAGTLDADNGGTSFASYVKGNLIVASAATTLQKLSVGTNGQVLTADSGETSGVKWADAPGTGTVTSIDVSGGTTGLTTSGGPVTISGTVTIAGTLIVANGGTGRTTGTTAYALVATGTTATGAQQTLAAGATTALLVGGGAAALPVWTTATGTGAPVRAGSPTFTTSAIVGGAFTLEDTGGSNGRILANAIFSVDADRLLWRNAAGNRTYLDMFDGGNSVTIGRNSSSTVILVGDTYLNNQTSNGFVKTGSGTGVLSVDTNTYLTGNETITLSGDVTGSGATSIATTLGNTAVTPASYTNANITVNSQGRITAASNGSSPPPPPSTGLFVLSSTNLNAAVTGFTSLYTAAAPTIVFAVVVRVTALASFSSGPTISVGTNSSSYNNVVSATGITISTDETLVTIGPNNGAIVIPTSDVLFANVSVDATAGTYDVTVEVLGYTV